MLVRFKFYKQEIGDRKMNAITEEVKVLDQQEREEQYDSGKPFDHTVKHSDAYYEQYMQSFVPNSNKRYFYRFAKRSFDIIVSLLMLALLSPVMLIIAIAIKCDSKGSVIFKQKRMGRNGQSFNCYKFRSMKIDAPKDCATSRLENPKQYQTKMGRILRKTSLDELPQLWCVLIGTMSFIGYRPLVLTEENCNDMRRRLNVFSARPGISGYAQVLGRDDVYYKNKAILDAEYVKNASLSFDLKLMFQTVAVVLKRKGNDDAKIKQS
jgi:O-antigen biosynthesis protein WbqP